MAKLNFGGVEETVVTRREFPIEKAREVLKDEVIAVLGYGVQGPGRRNPLLHRGGRTPRHHSDVSAQRCRRTLRVARHQAPSYRRKGPLFLTWLRHSMARPHRRGTPEGYRCDNGGAERLGRIAALHVSGTPRRQRQLCRGAGRHRPRPRAHTRPRHRNRIGLSVRDHLPPRGCQRPYR